MGGIRVRLEVSVWYIVNLLSPALVLGAALFLRPRQALIAGALALCAWIAYVSTDGTELRTGAPDKAYSQGDWFISTMRSYLKLTLHNTEAVEDALLAGPKPTQVDPGVSAGRINASCRSAHLAAPSAARLDSGSEGDRLSRGSDTQRHHPAPKPCARLPLRQQQLARRRLSKPAKRSSPSFRTASTPTSAS